MFLKEKNPPTSTNSLLLAMLGENNGFFVWKHETNKNFLKHNIDNWQSYIHIRDANLLSTYLYFFFKWMNGKIKPMPISSLARICITTYISIYFNTTTIVIIFCWLSMSFLQWPQSVIQFKDGLYLVGHRWVRNQIRGITYLVEEDVDPLSKEIQFCKQFTWKSNKNVKVSKM